MTKEEKEIIAGAEEAQKQNAAAREASFQSEADIDRRMTEMLQKDYQAEKEREEARIRRQMGARSLSDLGAVFTDMIRASEGARVDPRNLDAHYERMDDRQKQIYDMYRARMDLLAKQKADRDKARGAEARAAAQHDADNDWRMRMELLRQRHQAGEAAKERQNRAWLYSHGYGGHRNPDDEYFIDFGNGETKDYLDNTKEGRNVFGAIYEYLHSQGKIPDLTDKDGNIVPVKDQKTADALVRQYMYEAMQDPEIKQHIYKIAMGKNKDFRDPLTQNIDKYGANYVPPKRESFSPYYPGVPGSAPSAQQEEPHSTGGAY